MRAAFLALLLAAGSAAGAGLQEPQPSPAPAPVARDAEGRDAETLCAQARKLEARGDLEAARTAWLAAAPLLPIGAERDAAVGSARALEDRLAVRAEIRGALDAAPALLSSLELTAADAETVELAGERVPWLELDVALLRSAVTTLKGGVRAKRGLVLEALARGTPAERRTALTDLGRMLDKREIDAADAFAAVARARGEPIPPGGYLFQKGRWKVAGEVAAALENDALAAAATAFEDAGPADRDRLLAALAERGADGAARADQVLLARWNAALAALLRGTTLDQLAALEAQRAELDARRQAALALIFDEERYFYPYNPPACPPEKAKLYAGVQQEVDGLVERVREVWRAPRRVRLPATFRAALDEIAWSRAQQAQRKLAFAWPASLPACVLAIDPGAEAVDLGTFARDAKEAADLARDRAVAAFNARVWAEKVEDPLREANAEERRQVEITNEYRRMFGRRLLAWNPKVQVAAQKHADYMSFTGDFGHFEKDPARRTPGDRLRAEGYVAGSSENCHMGGGGAEGAHVGWTHSSGHHRNLLMPGHREMASAVAGVYWCQNFGAGREFEAQLAAK